MESEFKEKTALISYPIYIELTCLKTLVSTLIEILLTKAGAFC